VIHDYRHTRRGWGHDFTFTPRNGGQEASMVGWGHGLCVGDLLLMTNPKSSNGLSLYRIEEVSYFPDPEDMWSASVRWAPLNDVSDEEKSRAVEMAESS